MPGSSGGTTDPVKIVANIFISFIGAGVLGLPYAFKRVSSPLLISIPTLSLRLA